MDWPRLTGLVANLVLLYATDDVKERLDDVEAVEVAFKDAKGLLRFGRRVVDVANDGGNDCANNVGSVVEILQQEPIL